MPEYLAPGVYVEEVDTGSKPIEGVSTSTAGMVGVTERGPVGVPILITGFGEFTHWFGERLNPLDFPGGHSYLPHAVEGFFTNGGKRLYVTRVLDAELSDRAAGRLFGVGGTGTLASTRIVRPIRENTGTVLSPPVLMVLDGGGLTPNDWVRIGDGSDAEYRQVVAVSPHDELVPLALPLARSHFTPGVSIPVEEFVPGAPVGTPDLVADVAAGSSTVELTGTAAEILALPGGILEFGGVLGEHRYVRTSTVLGPTRARVQLDSPLMFGYPQTASLAILTPTPVPASANLDPEARAGDAMVFVNTRGGNFTTRTNLVVIHNAATDEREVRRIGSLVSVTLAPSPSRAYPVGTLVEQAALAPSGTTVRTVAAALATVLDLDDVSTIVPGQRLLAGTGAEREIITVGDVVPTALNVHVTVPLGLTAPKTTVGAPVIPLRRLTAPALAGASYLALDNRLGLQVGDVLQVGSDPDDEYITIAALPARAPAGVRPDAGNVVLETPLARAHEQATTDVMLLRSVVLGTPLHRTVLALPALSGDTQVVLADGDGYVGDTLLRITTPDGVSHHRILATPAPAAVAAQRLEVNGAVERPHAAGVALVERAPLLDVQALDPGAWGNRLRLSIQQELTGLVARTTVTSSPPISGTVLRFASSAGIEAGTVLELLAPDTDAPIEPLLKVLRVDRATGEVTLADALTTQQESAITAAGSGRIGVRSREFRLTVMLLRQPDPLVPSRNETVIATELFRHLSMDVRHSRYAPAVIGRLDGPLRLGDRRPEGESWYIRVADVATTQADLESIRLGPEALLDVLPDGRTRPARHALAGGDDDVGIDPDRTYIGVDATIPEERTGLHSLKNVEQISIVACPGQTSVAIQSALVNHCELMRYRFAVLDSPPPPADSLTDVQNLRQQFDTKYAAIYYPWVNVPDPFPTTTARAPELAVPPSGHMLGVYARTDIERGVHKAPANEVVRGILGVRRLINKEQHDILNPYPVNINVIRDFRRDNRGLRVYGGRVITSDSDYKYVNVRRLLIFIEHSIDRGLQWVVFEPNAEPLWARVRRSISNFLTLVWRNGGLEGTKVDEAFYVKCDRTTMTQTDIDSGRLICQVGVAPVKPAEFVIVRIGLWTAHADN